MEHVEFIDLNNTRSGIYCIFNVRNGKLYIGSAVNLRRRVGLHIRTLMKNNHHNKYLQRVWNKDGIISFLFIVMEYCGKDKLIEREQYFINLFDFDNQLYNILPTAGSQLGCKRSDEFRKKMSNVTRNMSKETRKKISEAGKGKNISEETRKKISFGNKGKIRSDKQRKRLSKPVHQIDISTGEILTTFNSAREVERILGVSNTNISAACTGKRKTAYGYKWQHVNNQN